MLVDADRGLSREDEKAALGKSQERRRERGDHERPRERGDRERRREDVRSGAQRRVSIDTSYELNTGRVFSQIRFGGDYVEDIISAICSSVAASQY